MVRRHLPWVADPRLTFGVAVLAVNDHVLKAAWPGWWTGKLSDLAGLYVVGAVAAASTRRRAAVLPVGLAFCALKLVPVVAAGAAPFLGGVTVSDPTDLVALAVLAPAARFAGAAGPSVRDLARSALAGAAFVALVGSVSATSCAEPSAVDLVTSTPDGQVFARLGGGHPGPAEHWASSDDGGASWSPSGAPPQATLDQANACGSRCYRVVRHRTVEEQRGDRWVVSFAYTDEQLQRLRRRMQNTCGIGRPADFGVVDVVETGGGEHVVVTAGAQGVLHRDPSGRWTRVAVLDSKPISLRGPSWLWNLSLAPLLLLPLLVVPLVVGWRRRNPTWALVAGAVGLLLVVGLVSLDGFLAFVGVDYVVFGPLIAALATLVFVVSIVVATRPGGQGEDP